MLYYDKDVAEENSASRVISSLEKGGGGMLKRRRVTAFLLAAALCFVMLFSVCCVALGANHNCVGEACPICFQINRCNDLLKASAFFISAAVFSAAAAFAALRTPTESGVFCGNFTLVSNKIKLSN